MNKLCRHVICIWEGTPDLGEMRDACIQMTWDDGQSATSRLSSIASRTVEESIYDADVFVCLCRTTSDDLKRYCRLAASQLKPVIIFCFNVKDSKSQRELESLIEGSPAGSSIRYATEEACVFAKEYLISLHAAVRTLDGTGSAMVSEHMYFPNRFFQRLSSRMNQWWVLHQRSQVHPFLKQAIAEFVLDCYLRPLVGAGVFNWFFESGSSLSFLSQSFAARLDDGWLKLWADFNIETNNIFSYLEFLVAPSQRTALFPPGPPDHKYGATYGDLLSLEPPENHDALIRGRARDLMRDLRNHFKDRYRHNGIIFGGVSGIDLASGPHVGSYPNMLFKRGMLESRCPIVMLLDEDKIAFPFNPETCYSVCDSEFPWPEVCREVPLALACAYHNRENAMRLAPRLEALGFHEIASRDRYRTPWCVVSANDEFCTQIDKWKRAERGMRGSESNSTADLPIADAVVQ